MRPMTGTRIESALAGLVTALSARGEVRRVILFGSRSRGDAGERADVDLAVEAPRATQRQWLDIARLAEEADTLLPIDLVRLEAASPGLRARILREGRTLYERPENAPEP